MHQVGAVELLAHKCEVSEVDRRLARLHIEKVFLFDNVADGKLVNNFADGGRKILFRLLHDGVLENLIEDTGTGGQLELKVQCIDDLEL